jgi:formylglycine-generating enzyme required for sulfatase activity
MPAHRVTISQGFWMDVTEVTVGSYRLFTQATARGDPPTSGFAQGDNHPVVNVSWQDATAFCRWVGGRLPTEGEWEYAARGGREGLIYPWGDKLGRNDANWAVGSMWGRLAKGRDRWMNTTPVGSYAPSGYGLMDLAGNVWEWLADWYDEGYFATSPAKDPPGPASGTLRVVRGGSWADANLRISNRFQLSPLERFNTVGFRCAGDEGGGLSP